MKAIARTLTPVYWTATVVLLAVGVYMSFFYAPQETTMGEVQRIFYFHLPIAINTFVACFIVFIASAGYLWQRTTKWDDLADAAARVAVIYATIVLITGMMWGRKAWGQWWTWSPRLTFSLVLWLLYVVYLLIRPAIESPRRRAIVSAVYGVIAFLDVPLVYLSVKLLPDIHPSSIKLAPEMQQTLLLWFVPVTMLSVGLFAARYRVGRLIRARERSDEAESETTHTAQPARSHA